MDRGGGFMPARILDLTSIHLANENEIDNAIYAVLCAAFGEDKQEPQVRRGVRARLGRVPTAAEVVEAACTELRCRAGFPTRSNAAARRRTSLRPSSIYRPRIALTSRSRLRLPAASADDDHPHEPEAVEEGHRDRAGDPGVGHRPGLLAHDDREIERES